VRYHPLREIPSLGRRGSIFLLPRTPSAANRGPKDLTQRLWQRQHVRHKRCFAERRELLLPSISTPRKAAGDLLHLLHG
jgi:hypothetical protein